MENKFNINQIVLPLLIIAVLGGAIYYFTQKNKNNEAPDNKKTFLASKGPIVLGDSDGQTTGNSSINNTSPTNNTTTGNNTGIVNDGTTYMQAITDIRLPINKAFEDLSSKIKYSSLFTAEETTQTVENIKKLIDEGKTKMLALKFTDKYKASNDLAIKSIDYLSEAINAFEKLQSATVQTEKQKYSDLFNYNIDQSNTILKDIAVPK